MYFLTNAKIENYTGTDFKFDTMTHLGTIKKDHREHQQLLRGVPVMVSTQSLTLLTQKYISDTLIIYIAIKKEESCFKAVLSTDKSYSRVTVGSGRPMLQMDIILLMQTWSYESKLYIHNYVSK